MEELIVFGLILLAGGYLVKKGTGVATGKTTCGQCSGCGINEKCSVSTLENKLKMK